MIHLTYHEALDLVTRTIAVCGVLHSSLPPWDWDPEFVKVGLEDFPPLQKAFYNGFHNRYYKLLIYIVGYIALHGRSTIWGGSISIKNQMDAAVAQSKPGNGA